MNQERFDQLIQEWQRVASIHSFPWTIMRGIAYEELRAAGLSIVPMLIEQLKTDPWIAYSWLLQEITGDILPTAKAESF